MKTHNIHQYIHLGAYHWYLVKIPTDLKASDALSAILELKKCIEGASLQITTRAGWELWTIAKELKQLPADEIVKENVILKIRQKAEDLENTLTAEAEGKVVYVVTEKRIDTEKLLNRPFALLANNVWFSLPVISARDFNVGCRAIAFELPTAGAFSLLRCVEGALKHLYFCNIKRNRLPEKEQMWGPMIKQLRDKKSDKPPIELLDTLDRIRVNFRNPTDHPKKEYDLDEAQDLFGLCVDALNRIVKSKQWKAPEECYGVIFSRGSKQSAEE